MLRVTFEDGSVREYSKDEVIRVQIGISSEPKRDYERTREYPPEYRRFNQVRAGVLTPGHFVDAHPQPLKVASVERVER